MLKVAEEELKNNLLFSPITESDTRYHTNLKRWGWFTVGPLMDVNLGDIVIAWMDGGSRVRQGRVERFVLRTLLTIDFEDGSVSENTLPSDIVQCGCIRQQGCRDGQHQPGSRVR
ncbi:hypothetical protein COOONC_18137 [Cooperia oncophora]